MTVVVRDTTPPVLTLRGSSAMVWGIGTAWVDPGWRATDNLDSPASLEQSVIVIPSSFNVNAPIGTVFTLRYSLSDLSGNAMLVDLERSVTISETSAPTRPSPTAQPTFLPTPPSPTAQPTFLTTDVPPSTTSSPTASNVTLSASSTSSSSSGVLTYVIIVVLLTIAIVVGVIVWQRRKRIKYNARDGIDGSSRSHRRGKRGRRSPSTTANPVFASRLDARDLTSNRDPTLATGATNNRRAHDASTLDDYELPSLASTVPGATGTRDTFPLGTDSGDYEVPVPVYAEPRRSTLGHPGRSSNNVVKLDRELYVSGGGDERQGGQVPTVHNTGSPVNLQSRATYSTTAPMSRRVDINMSQSNQRDRDSWGYGSDA